ncbi:hypothetical protein SDC9_120210 [bioreactor metagenome]|uniref:Uncharacterized protein n=1 Tax=bioreactor metagenome TaxID=1076179 RepID=A0A645C9N7_9ZZZZ
MILRPPLRVRHVEFTVQIVVFQPILQFMGGCILEDIQKDLQLLHLQIGGEYGLD